jgi:hypothetical protein
MTLGSRVSGSMDGEGLTVTSQGDRADGEALGRRLFVLRLMLFGSLVLALAPLFAKPGYVRLPGGLDTFYFIFLIPASFVYLGGMLLCKERPGLFAVASLGVVSCALCAFCGLGALDEVPDLGFGPVVWAGLLALSQVTIVVAARSAWLEAPARGPFRYVEALGGAFGLFLLFWTLTSPIHGHPPVSRNEARAIGDLRTMMAAEDAYRLANGGFFDTPACLAAPRRCNPAYPVDGPVLMDSGLWPTAGVVGGYRRVFHAGPAADAAAILGAKASPSSLVSFAFVAVPVRFLQTGVRSFCGDATGRICSTGAGQTPAVEAGECAASCKTLQ